MSEGDAKGESNQLVSLWDDIDEAVYIADPHTYEILYANRAITLMMGDVTGKTCYSAFQGRLSPCPFCTNKYILGKNLGKTYIWDFKNRINNHWYHCIDKAIRWTNGKMVRYEMAIDISKRKQTEDALAKSEKKYRFLVEHASEGIIVAQHGGLRFVNPKAVEFIGRPKEDLKARPFLEFVHPDDRKKVAKYSLKKVKGETCGQLYSFRVIDGSGNVKWVKTSSVGIEWEGKPAILSFLTDVTSQKEIEGKLKDSLEKLKKVIEGNVQAMAIAAEMRDPYTAGHQRRVCRLACAIAQKMGLSETQIEGISVAAILHDIGKLRVPAEILSKPTRLTDIEMSLIKIHPKVGYDILKTEAFSWPIAQIVLQHHERIDGTGYPQGLSGGDMLLESRILAVADVVEAMASHRPYRPALGVDKALEEITQQAGTLYDPDVAVVCADLFSNKGFEF